MNLLQVIILISSLLNIFLGLVVLKRKTRSKVNLTFSIFALSTGLWTGANFLLLYSPNLLLLKTAYALGSLMASAFLSWLLIFCYRRTKFVYLSYLAGLIFFGLNFSSFVIKRLISFSATGSVVTYGALFPVYSFYMVFMFVLMLGVLIKSFKIEHGPKKTQISFILLGISLFGIFSLTFSFFLPLFRINTLLMMDSPTSLFFVAFSAYAIIKHRLMDIRLLILKSVAYSILLLAVASLYIFTIFFLQSRYGAFLPVHPNTIFIIAGFVVAFGFQPLKNLLEKYTDRIFAKGRYNPEELLDKLGGIMTSTMMFKLLADSTLKTIIKEMRINRAALAIAGSPRLAEVKAVGFEDALSQPWDEIVGLVKDKEIIVADEFEEDSKEKNVLRKTNLAVVAPLQVETDLVGLLMLGEKRSGDMYTLQDIKFLKMLSPELAIAVKNAQLFGRMEKKIAELNALNKVATSLSSTLALPKLLNDILEEALFVIGAESGSIMLVDEKTQTLRIKTARGIDPEILGRTRVKMGEGIAGWVAQSEEPLVLVDAKDERFREDLRRAEIISSLTVPLKAKDKVIGVLNVNRKTTQKIFSEDDLKLATALAAGAATAIENAKLYEDLENTVLGSITALANAIDAKDPYTRGHSGVVTEYAVEIAREFGFSKEEIETIRIAGTLHDIGKIGIAESILNKPGPLSSEERTMIWSHPGIGADILQSLKFLRDVIPLVYYHHERYDGTGYPSGIACKEIPLGARILAVADAFNAMISTRPYRPALSLEKAKAELRIHSGTQFDPQVVDVFLRVLEKRKSPTI